MNRCFATVLFMVLVLLGASSSATARRHRRARALVMAHPVAPSGNRGAKVDSTTGAAIAAPVPLVKLSTGFVEFHSARVENDLMLFQPTLIGLTPPGVSRSTGLSATQKEARFFVPVRSSDDLEMRRDRDRLLLFREPQPGGGMGLGVMMFGAMTVLSAHAPGAFRALFDGPVHLGPAIFDGGGMGAGIAGRGL